MNRIYGYCRISTNKQNIERQVRNILSAYPNAIIVKETYTGTKSDGRKEYSKIRKTVQEGDTIVFDSVSRMSRNAEEGIQEYFALMDAGITLVFMKEHYIDTDTYKKAVSGGVPMTGTNVDCILEGVNKYLKALAKEQIQIAFEQAQKEVDDLHQRTREGIETARLDGKQIGGTRGAGTRTVKKAATAKEDIRKLSRDFDGTLVDAEVIRLTGLARNTYYKYKRELRETKENG